MMKNLLLTAALVSASVAGMAQGIKSVSELKAMRNASYATKQVKAVMGGQAAAKATNAIAPNSVLDGVFYYRPSGVLYSGYTFGDSYDAIAIPALTDIQFDNGCNIPELAEWLINGQDANDYTDEDNNFVMSWLPATTPDQSGMYYAPYYAPTIKNGRTEFKLTEIALVMNDIAPMSHINGNKATIYTGFEGAAGPAFGTNSVLENAVEQQVAGADVEYAFVTYEKPVSPLYVESFELMYLSSKTKPFTGDAKVTLTVYPQIEVVDEQTGETYLTVDWSNPTEVIESNDYERIGQLQGGTDYYGTLTFAKIEQGVFGEELGSPIVIDYPFAIAITGYNQKGVDIGFFLADIGDDPYECEMGAHTFFYTRVNDEYRYYRFNGVDEKGIPYGYEMNIMINAMYDKVEVADVLYDNAGNAYEKCNVLRVSEDGKTVTNEYQPKFMGDICVLSTALPFFITDENGTVEGENYEVEDMPEWLQIMIDPSQWEKNGMNYVGVEAEALPEGVKGRYAEIRFIGKGVTNEIPMLVVQGDVEASGIKDITVAQNANVVYTVAGNMADKNFKGITISKGAKKLNK